MASRKTIPFQDVLPDASLCRGPWLLRLPGVEYHQKQRFSNAIMLFDPDGSEIHFLQKTYYSREGSAGGIGATAGGGCGCY